MRGYTLHEIPNEYKGYRDPDDPDVPASLCIYCGETVRHVNDGGHGWIGGTLLANGEPLYFMYHGSPPCEAATRASERDRIWHCLCGDPEGGTYDNVGSRCHNCGGPQPPCDDKGRRTDCGAPVARSGTTDNSYYAMVWLERDVSDDFGHGVVEPEPGDTPASAAKRQIARELQTTCDDAGLPAGFFRVEAVFLGNHKRRLQQEFYNLIASQPHVWALVWQSEDGTLLHSEAFASRDEAFRWAANELMPIREIRAQDACAAE